MATSTALATYEQARVALQQCARVDEAAKIKDKAERLKAYARIANDDAMERWVTEILVRAEQRMGELSAALDKAQTVRNEGGASVRLPNDGKSKAAALADAGISTSRAHRAEQLAGGTSTEGQAAARSTTDEYFTEARRDERMPSLSELRSKIDNVIDQKIASGELTVSKPKRAAKPQDDPSYFEWQALATAIDLLASKTDADLSIAAHKSSEVGLLARDLTNAETAVERARRWHAALKQEIRHGSL